MIKRYNNNSTYKIETEKAIYMVVMERLKNTPSGTSRYKANIITLLYKGDPENTTGIYYTAVYTFTGHYLNETGEARKIVEHYENERG